MQKYQALVDFRLKFNDGKDTVELKRGDTFMFDGQKVQAVGNDGVTYVGPGSSLAKLQGEWFKAAPQSATLAPPPVVAAPVTVTPPRQFNTTGNDTVEDSNVSGPDKDQNLNDLVHQYEKGSGLVSNDKPLPDENIGRIKKDAGVITEKQAPTLDKMIDQYDEKSNLVTKKGTKIENDDSTIVAKTKGPNEQANTPAVQIAEESKSSKLVISHEENVAKATNYAKKPVGRPPKKKMEIVNEMGEVVKKVQTPAIKKEEVKVASEKSEVAVDSVEVMKTEPSVAKPVDVGASTQVQTTDTKPRKVAIVQSVQDMQSQQEGVVVAKVRKESSVATTEDGIVSKVTVKATDDESIQTTVGGNDQDIIMNDDLDIGDILTDMQE